MSQVDTTPAGLRKQTYLINLQMILNRLFRITTLMQESGDYSDNTIEVLFLVSIKNNVASIVDKLQRSSK